MPGLSCAAQRGCWKLFQETPTVQGLAAVETAGVAAVVTAEAAGGCGTTGAVVEPELEQADAMSAATEINATALRLIIIEILPPLRVRGMFPVLPTASECCAGPSSYCPLC